MCLSDAPLHVDVLQKHTRSLLEDTSCAAVSHARRHPHLSWHLCDILPRRLHTMRTRQMWDERPVRGLGPKWRLASLSRPQRHLHTNSIVAFKHTFLQPLRPFNQAVVCMRQRRESRDRERNRRQRGSTHLVSECA